MTEEDEEFERIKRRIELETLLLINFTKQKEWVDLTDEEIGLLTTGDGWSHLETPVLALFARAIEAKLKEKNYDRRN